MDPESNSPEFSLRDMMETLRRRKWVILQAFLFVTIIGAITAWLSPAVYATQAKLLVDLPGAYIPIVNVQGDSPLAPLQNLRLKRNMKTHLAVLRSSEFANRVRKKVLARTAAAPALSYEPDEGTSIITIRSEGTDRQATADWANAACTAFMELSNETSRSASEEMLKTLEKSQTEAAKRLQKAQAALAAFQRRTNFVSNPEVQGVVFESALDLMREVRNTNSELIQVRSTIQSLEAQLKAEPAVVVEQRIIPNPEKEEFRRLIAELKIKRARLLTEYLPEAQPVKDIEAQIADVEAEGAKYPVTIQDRFEQPNPKLPKLRQELEQARQSERSLRAKLDALDTARVKDQSRLDNSGTWEVERQAIQRELDDASKAYTDYSDQVRAMRTRLDAQQASNWDQILEPATVPVSPVKPAKAQQVGMAMLLGLLLGVGLAFLQEFLDDRVNTTDDVERMTALPTLGVVPTIQGNQNRLLIGQDAFSPITESYRALRTAVQYSTVDHRLQLIGVTSAHPGEGKSVTSANLAIAIALQGKRVLLVDADLRRPSVHRLFQHESEPGLTSVLAGEVALEEALRETLVDGLRVLPSGPLPPNPPELLNSQVMMDLLEQLRQVADVVIFDTPPVIPVTDSQVLGSHLDGVVLVVETGQARKAAVKHARELLDRTRVRLVGVVLNKIDQSGKGYYHYYYHRGGYRKGGRYGGYGYGGYGSGYGGRHGGGYGYGAGTGARVGRELPEAEPRPRLPERLKDWE